MEFHTLTAEDAVSYLDQVKSKFGNQPHVFNEFLEILIEFKSESIDTSSVLQRALRRVPNLFREHPELIVGFNVFLPPECRIELPNERPPSEANSQIQADSQKQPPQHQNSPPHFRRGGVSPGSGNGPNSAPPPANQLDVFMLCVNYVIKIKNRFQDQPEIYRRFLEILQAYKERSNLKDSANAINKPITEEEVYDEVAKLFKNHEDLLQEFGQFLRDGTTQFSWIWYD